MKSRILCLLALFLPMACRDSPPLGPAETDPEALGDARPTASLSADQAPLTGRIVFSRRTAGSGDDIWVMNADGSDTTRLTDHPLAEDEPAWSPDGRRIAFVRDFRTLWVMNADGSLPTALAQGLSPDWAPDGVRIAYWGGGVTDIQVVNADGSSWVNLTNSPDWEKSPAWSPDGSKIAFDSNRGGAFDIWVMNADGSNQEQLTFDGLNFSPAWSPDGSKIAFESTRTGAEGIWVMNADGTGAMRLADAPGAERGPTWSPDGEWIAFVKFPPGERGLYAIDKAGGNLTALTNRFGDLDPDWTAGDAPPDPRVLQLLEARAALLALLGNTMDFAVADLEIQKSLAAIERGPESEWEAKLRIWGLSVQVDGLIKCCIPESEAKSITRDLLRPAWDGLRVGPVPRSPEAAMAFSEVLVRAAVQLRAMGVVTQDQLSSVAGPLDRAGLAARAGERLRSRELFSQVKPLTADRRGPWWRYGSTMVKKDPPLRGVYDFFVLLALNTTTAPWN